MLDAEGWMLSVLFIFRFTKFVFKCRGLRPGLSGALFARRYDEQKSGSGGRKCRSNKANDVSTKFPCLCRLDRSDKSPRPHFPRTSSFLRPPVHAQIRAPGSFLQVW